jgi:hypothetical protein
MIVSVHIPKTAGSAFKDLLIERLGQEQVCLRYEQTPLRWRSEVRQVPPLIVPEGASCAVVHGHFVADRVIVPAGAKAQYVAWLRHPVERLISHYLFWKRKPYVDQPLCRRLLEEDLTLEDFASPDAMRNLQRFFLGDVPASRFAFIGVTERFDESIDRFNATFGTSLNRSWTVNANPHKPGEDYRSEVGERIYQAIALLNAADVALYTQARASYD